MRRRAVGETIPSLANFQSSRWLFESITPRDNLQTLQFLLYSKLIKFVSDSWKACIESCPQIFISCANEVSRTETRFECLKQCKEFLWESHTIPNVFWRTKPCLRLKQKFVGSYQGMNTTNLTGIWSIFSEKKTGASANCLKTLQVLNQNHDQAWDEISMRILHPTHLHWSWLLRVF